MRKTTVALGFVVLALAGASAGCGVAGLGSNSAASAPAATSAAAVNAGASAGAVTLDDVTTTAATVADPSTANAPDTIVRPRLRALRRWLRGVEHGDLALRNGKTIEVQRGTVQAVNATSITVKCQDGFIASYTVTGTTVVTKQKSKSSIAQVVTGDHVLVVAQKTSTADTAVRIFDPGQRAKAGTSATTSGSGTSTD
jgi:hypothetical protein